MSTPTVSVIIPVFNTADYLAQAIESVLNQTLQDLEIIAVDDGSTDGSPEVLKSFGDKIRIITQPNSGQGAARNRAFAQARGEFVYFMDSDDIILPQTLETCVEICRKDNLDFVFFDGASFGEDLDINANPWFDYHRSAAYTQVQHGNGIMADMLERGIYRCSVCLCLFRSDFLRTHDIRFPEGILHEDEAFAAKAFIRASRTRGIPEEFFLRRIRKKSVMTTNFSESNVKGYLETLRLVTPLGGDMCERIAIDALTRTITTSLCYNSRKLPLRIRLHIAREIYTKYPYAFNWGQVAKLILGKPF